MSDTKHDDGEPAFPEVLKSGDLMAITGGLTKREIFALVAMHGLVSMGMRPSGDLDESNISSDEYRKRYPAWIAVDAIRFADTLIAELGKTPE